MTMTLQLDNFLILILNRLFIINIAIAIKGVVVLTMADPAWDK